MNRRRALGCLRSLFVVFVMLLAQVKSVAAEPQSFVSTSRKILLLEQYTSEMCPACPEAGQWFSQFKSNPGLWVDFVPVAFHVAYWDRPNMRDRFAQSIFAERQRRYFELKTMVNLRTPQFIFDGGAWERIMGFRNPIEASNRQVGILHVELDGDQINASFRPIGVASGPRELHIALLGTELTAYRQPTETIVRAPHLDFSALAYRSDRAESKKDEYQWQITLPKASVGSPARYALIAWVSRPDFPASIQAVGGWIGR